MRTILSIGDPKLREPARAVEPGELGSDPVQRLVRDLIDTMRGAHGAGLAATQIGVPLRVCVLEVNDNPRYPYKPKIPLTVLINPRVDAITTETFENYEGCLSVPNLRGVVPRAVGVRVRALDEKGGPIDREVWGLSAGTYQHEVDHLEGTLFVDRVVDSRTLCTWETFDAFHREAFVARAEALVARFGG
ncbi:MAG: peptide deformylase [Myxococcota bacterium]